MIVLLLINSHFHLCSPQIILVHRIIASEKICDQEFVFQQFNSFELGRYLEEAKITERDSLVEKRCLGKAAKEWGSWSLSSPSAKTEKYFSWAWRRRRDQATKITALWPDFLIALWAGNKTPEWKRQTEPITPQDFNVQSVVTCSGVCRTWENTSDHKKGSFSRCSCQIVTQDQRPTAPCASALVTPQNLSSISPQGWRRRGRRVWQVNFSTSPEAWGSQCYKSGRLMKNKKKWLFLSHLNFCAKILTDDIWINWI